MSPQGSLSSFRVRSTYRARKKTAVLSCVLVLSFVHCSDDDEFCSILDNGDGTARLECPDGRSITVSGPSDGGGSRDMAGDPRDGGSETRMDVLEGEFRISNQADIEFLAQFDSVSGDLFITTTGLPSVVVPNLRHVGGVVAIEPAPPDSIIGVRDNDLESVSMPQLEFIGSSLHINSQLSLRTVELPVLEEVAVGPEPRAPAGPDRTDDFFGSLMISRNANLRDVSLPNLRRVGPENDLNFLVDNNPALPHCWVLQIVDQLQDAGWTGNCAYGSQCNVAPFCCPEADAGNDNTAICD